MKKKAIIAVLCCLLVLISSIVYFSAFHPTFQPKPLRTIVIDAGHGGIDNGTSGARTGVKESKLNLDYAFTLAKSLENLNFEVILTRKDENGLYSLTAPNKKRSDMERRKQIIDSSGADLVISVHMNSFSLPSCQGAQVFYAKDNAEGQALAERVQGVISQNFSTARKNADIGDYYILNCTPLPAILVEFGFLSNPQEESLLQSEEYMQKICSSVAMGIMEYFEF